MTAGAVVTGGGVAKLTAGARLNLLKRVSHALGHTSAHSPACATAAVSALAETLAMLQEATDSHGARLGVDMMGAAAEWVQFEPEDMVAAELRSALATTTQALIVLAEAAVVWEDVSLAQAVFRVAAGVLSASPSGAASSLPSTEGVSNNLCLLADAFKVVRN